MLILIYKYVIIYVDKKRRDKAMAIKILSVSEKNNLNIDELLKYESKLREEVSRRESRFKENDKFFREKSLKYQETLHERSDSQKFPTRRAGNMEDIRIGIRILEGTIKSKQSTLKGRKEILDSSFIGFNANLSQSGGKPLSRTKYNRIAKFFDELDDNEDLAEYFYESGRVIEVVNEGIDFNKFVETINLLDEINKEKNYGMHHYSIDMVKEIYNEYKKNGEGEEIEKIFEKYARSTSESNE